MTVGSGSLNPRRMALFLQSGAPERLASAASFMAGAAALDWEIVVVLLGEALRKFAGDRLDDGAADGPEEARPAALMRSAVAFGRVTFLACSADARSSGFPEEVLRQRVDEILGMSTILRRVQDAGTKLYL
jgi:peroxiredoxin family protein